MPRPGWKLRSNLKNVASLLLYAILSELWFINYGFPALQNQTASAWTLVASELSLDQANTKFLTRLDLFHYHVALLGYLHPWKTGIHVFLYKICAHKCSPLFPVSEQHVVMET